MSQRTVILIAAGLTAFLLVVGGAIAGQLVNPTATLAAPEEPVPGSVVSPGEAQTSPDVQGWMEREAAYQELIREANQKLEEAYAQQEAAAATVPAEATYAISAEQAAEIALQAVPWAKLLGPAELVDFQGVVAYEVALNVGMVYVDANTGDILYNGAVVMADDSSSDASGFDSVSNAGSDAGFGGGGDDGGDD